ncbi:hypothetical protein [Roseobacter sp.]|uniref:hypothetical protein n=1 Tax=Roseobacter sp. TaxID=1907202 RepID=UPI0038598B6F
MPHAEIKFSSDLSFDAVAVLRVIETTILEHDDGSGACKGRAYPTDLFHHSHCLIAISMLRKPHRDTAFTARLLDALELAIKQQIKEPCYFSLVLDYSPMTYVTNTHPGAVETLD